METKQERKLVVGTLVKIKPEHTTRHGDWYGHKDSIGVITHYMAPNAYGYDFKIKWPDGSTSSASKEYVIIMIGDWDE